MTSKQNSIDLMIQHGLEGIYSVDNIKSSGLRMSLKLHSATSIKFFGRHIFTIAHVDVIVNF
jgi:hypothetical protein